MTEQITVCTALMPACYKDFRCIMGECQDNCCDDGWKIEFSKKDYLTIKRAVQSEALKTKMEQSMSRLRDRAHDNMYAEFHVSEAGRCAFHTKEGLCSLQLECGEAVLPRVCRIFPRQTFYTPAAKEFSLSMACEGVLALLWDLPQGIDFWEEPLEKSDWRDYQPPHPIIARFADIRALCVDVLQERSMPLPKCLLLLGFLLQKLRDRDWAREEAVDQWLTQGEALLHSPTISKELDGLPGNKGMFLGHCHRVMHSILLTNRSRQDVFQKLWDGILLDANSESAVFDIGHYEELEERLAELLGHSDYFFENLMVTALFYLHVPVLVNPEELWKSFVNLCHLYSLFRFSAVCAMELEASRERLFHILVAVSRALLHNNSRQAALRDEFFQNDSATLAHMAILVGG